MTFHMRRTILKIELGICRKSEFVPDCVHAEKGVIAMVKPEEPLDLRGRHAMAFFAVPA